MKLTSSETLQQICGSEPLFSFYRRATGPENVLGLSYFFYGYCPGTHKHIRTLKPERSPSDMPPTRVCRGTPIDAAHKRGFRVGSSFLCHSTTSTPGQGAGGVEWALFESRSSGVAGLPWRYAATVMQTDELTLWKLLGLTFAKRGTTRGVYGISRYI